MKQCRSCGVQQPVKNFNTHSNKKPRATCKTCERSRHYKRSYGISIEDYERMYTEQGGVCKICHLPPNHNSNLLCIDHCHETGKVRALLCDLCNRGLGYFKDDTRLLDRASEYLRAYEGGLQNLPASSVVSTSLTITN